MVRRRARGAGRRGPAPLRPPHGLGAADDAVARVPELVARLGQDRPRAGRAPLAADAGLPRLRRFGQAARARLLAPRAGRPGRGTLGARRRDRHDRGRSRLRGLGGPGAAGAAGRWCACRRPPGGPPPQRRPLPGRPSPAADPARAARPGAGPPDQRAGHRGAVRGRASGHVRRLLRRECRQLRHLGLHEPGRRPPHLLSPDPLPRGPRAPRAALDRRARGDRGPARVRLGDARPDLGRAHGRAHPGATSGRGLRGARGRVALASARGAGAREPGAARLAGYGIPNALSG